MRKTIEPGLLNTERHRKIPRSLGGRIETGLGKRTLHAQARIKRLLGMLPEQLDRSGSAKTGVIKRLAVHDNTTRPGLQVPSKETAERGLARTGGCHKRNVLARLDRAGKFTIQATRTFISKGDSICYERHAVSPPRAEKS